MPCFGRVREKKKTHAALSVAAHTDGRALDEGKEERRRLSRRSVFVRRRVTGTIYLSAQQSPERSTAPRYGTL